MRVAELSKQSGVSVATIKYYLREGLLPRGESTGPNQAQYGERHLRRLQLVRALIDVGGLSIAATRDLLVYLDEPGVSLGQRLGSAMGSVTQVKRRAVEGDRGAARAIVADLVERRGWEIDVDDPACDNLVEVVAAIAAIGGTGGDALLSEIDRFAVVAEIAARGDLEAVTRPAEPDAAVETAVVGTIVGDTLISALRRLAQVNEAGRLFREG